MSPLFAPPAAVGSVYLTGAKVSTPLEGIDVAFHQSADYAGLSFIVSRKTYGHFADDGFAGHLATAAKVGAIPGSYLFLRPGTVDPIAAQVATFVAGVNPGLAFLDWEEDSGPGFDNGRATLAEVEQAIALCRKAGVDPGVYGSLGVIFDHATVARLLALKVRMFWVAAYDGIQIPDWLLHCGVPIFHQYAGTTVDRDRFFGTPEQLHALAGQKVQGDSEVRYNLTPGLALRTLTVKPGAIIWNDSAAKKRYSQAGADAAHTTFPFLGSYPTTHVIADGDSSAYVRREDVLHIDTPAAPVGYGA